MVFNDFFADIYEFFYNPESGFMGLVYDEGLYMSLVSVLLITSVILMATFYYIIDHEIFKKWYHWLIIGGVNVLVNGIFAYALSFNVATTVVEPGTFSIEFYLFALENGLLSFLVYTIFSFAFRWKSKACRHSPFSFKK